MTEDGRLSPVKCAREGCAHPYDQHAPAGGGCMYWFPLNGEHCPCRGFQFVRLDGGHRPVGSRS